MSWSGEVRAALEQVMARDRGRLIARWKRLSASTDPTAEAIAALRADIDKSAARRAQRALRAPKVEVDADLPIAAHADDIVALIRAHQVIVLAGETGSGKTTQLPKLCLAAGRGSAGLIGCTQPRRIAARTVARRVADELNTTLGDVVGFQVRFTEVVGDNTLVKFMTDGILLAETQSDPWLGAYDTIILDEAHERSLNIDFLLGYLKRLLARRPDLKLIVTSATIDTARFSGHFNGAPVVEVEGRAYPVEVRWRPAPERGETSPADQVGAAVDEITAEDPRGDVLVFLPGEREIRDVHLALSRRNYRHTEVLPLYARLSAGDQDRVFRPGAPRRIVLATNVAETSLTVPRIRYVVDTGSARIKRYSQRNQLERLHIEPISQSAADQRRGRCGRVGPGICYRLYDEADFLQRPRYTEPEILRSSLAGVILRMLSLKLGDVAEFPFIETPGERAIGDGYRRLVEIGAIDAQRHLTAIGHTLAKLPIDVALGRMLVDANQRGVLASVLVLAAFLSTQDPRERPADARPQADAAHAVFVDPKSDFLGIVKLWNAWQQAHADLTQSKLRDWCRAHFLSFMRMREWRELHRQLLLIADQLGWSTTDTQVPSTPAPAPETTPGRRKRRRGRGRSDDGAPAANAVVAKAADTSRLQASPAPGTKQAEQQARAHFEAIHRSLLSGWPTQVGRKDERGQYLGTRERRFGIFPGSALSKAPPQWLLAGQIIDTGRVYAMSCARVEPDWIEQQAAHLVKRSWNDAHWSRKRGSIMAYEQVSLFGLVLVEKRPVQFGAQDPARAHAIFVSEALARCDIDCRAGFARANAEVLARAHEIEARQRRVGLIRSDEELIGWFDGKLPVDIHGSVGLDRWYQRASPAAQAALHWSLDDVMAKAAGTDAGDFPAELTVADQRLRLEYRFIPGDAADGVSLHIPLALLNAVPATRCEWLVPGLLAEKVAELIRGLPKPLRRNFVPAPDFARAFVETAPAKERALAAELAGYLRRVTGVEITAGDFVGIDLPAHLQMRVVVEDEQGAELAHGRDLAVIQRELSSAARAAFASRADTDLTRENLTTFDFADIPETVEAVGDLVGFLALVDLGDSVALRVFENADEANAQHRGGVERLLRRALADRIKQATRQLPLSPVIALRWAPFGRVESLRAELVEAALSERLAQLDLHVRTQAQFEQRRAQLARELFPTAVEHLKRAEAIIDAQVELLPWLEPLLIGHARANYDDLREQLAELLPPGFLRSVDSAQLAHFPRYLHAMRLRAMRLREDPVRDQARMITVQAYWRDYLRLRATRGGDDDELSRLHWAIEELRVSLFAQELRTAEPVSPKRLTKLIAALEAGPARREEYD